MSGIPIDFDLVKWWKQALNHDRSQPSSVAASTAQSGPGSLLIGSGPLKPSSQSQVPSCRRSGDGAANGLVGSASSVCLLCATFKPGRAIPGHRLTVGE
jgi:hypothetical protein